MLPELDEKIPGLRDKLLDPLTVDINPDYVTFLALLIAGAAGYLFSQTMFLAAGVLVLISGYLDILDGYIARQFGSTRRGDFLDHTFDRLADVAILAGLAFAPVVPTSIGLATTLAVVLVSYLGTQAQALTDERVYGGLLSRSDRMILLTLIGVTGSLRPAYVEPAVYLILGLSILTFLQRFYQIDTHLRAEA